MQGSPVGAGEHPNVSVRQGTMPGRPLASDLADLGDDEAPEGRPVAIKQLTIHFKGDNAQQ